MAAASSASEPVKKRGPGRPPDPHKKKTNVNIQGIVKEPRNSFDIIEARYREPITLRTMKILKVYQRDQLLLFQEVLIA